MGMMPKILNAVGCIICSQKDEELADAVSLEEKNTYLLKVITGSIKILFLSYHWAKDFLGINHLQILCPGVCKYYDQYCIQ